MPSKHILATPEKMRIGMSRSYSELIRLKTFEERFSYLLLGGKVSEETFGWARYLNQNFYRSKEWKSLRDKVIIRDDGCDLAHLDHPIQGKIYIHHLNPIREEDIVLGIDSLMDPDNLVCVSFKTHQAIHYGDLTYLKQLELVNRSPNDQAPWRS